MQQIAGSRQAAAVAQMLLAARSAASAQIAASRQSSAGVSPEGFCLSAAGELLSFIRGRPGFAAGAPPMATDDDPNVPYKLYDGDKLIRSYQTRAEARRAQQKLESEAGSEQRHFTIKDRLGRVVL